MAPTETSVLGRYGEVNEGTLRFGLPSVSSQATSHFGSGKKANEIFSGAQAWVTNPLRYDTDGAISLIRDWTIVNHADAHGGYMLENGSSYIAFHPPYDLQKPTPEMLRQIFGKYIIFPNDDMQRVHKVRGGFYPEELVLNDSAQ